MSAIHAGPSVAPAVIEGRCAYRWHWEDVTLWCSDDAIPGLAWCADHFIAACHRRADAGIPPATPTAVKAEAAARRESDVSDHPAKLVQGDDEDYVDYLGRQADAWRQNPPPAPEGFVLVECAAQPRHWPEYTVADSDFYDAFCSRCAYDSLYDAHVGCEHSHHRAWRRWRITGKIAGWLYTSGLTSSGGSWRMGGGCPGCWTMPKWNRRKRPYILWVRREAWRCLLKGHHWPGEPIIFGFCGKCLPCPDCGSTAAEHHCSPVAAEQARLGVSG